MTYNRANVARYIRSASCPPPDPSSLFNGLKHNTSIRSQSAVKRLSKYLRVEELDFPNIGCTTAEYTSNKVEHVLDWKDQH